MSRHHVAKNLTFDVGVLRVRMCELLEGPEDGLIGKPLEELPASQSFDVIIEQVGHIQIRPEPMGALSARAERLHEFLFREDGTEFLAKHAWGAVTLASPRLPRDATVVHYVVYAESYVVDVLAARELMVVEVAGGAV